jgi:hypothetical protein
MGSGLLSIYYGKRLPSCTRYRSDCKVTVRRSRVPPDGERAGFTGRAKRRDRASAGFSRKGTRWDLVLQTLCAYRLIDPGSEWRLHRHWFEQSAMGDLLGADLGGLAESHKLYQCHDLILEHKNARFDVLLYDLTSSYFESNAPFPEEDKRKHGYSRDKRPDCVQVVIALPTTDDREIILTRHTQPEADQELLLEKLKLTLPEQPPPKITVKQGPKSYRRMTACSADL